MKTTIYLPEGLKRRLTRLARSRGTSEAALIRRAVESYVNDSAQRPRPTVPLFNSGDGTIADRVDELLKGFGE